MGWTCTFRTDHADDCTVLYYCPNTITRIITIDSVTTVLHRYRCSTTYSNNASYTTSTVPIAIQMRYKLKQLRTIVMIRQQWSRLLHYITLYCIVLHYITSIIYVHFHIQTTTTYNILGPQFLSIIMYNNIMRVVASVVFV